MRHAEAMARAGFSGDEVWGVLALGGLQPETFRRRSGGSSAQGPATSSASSTVSGGRGADGEGKLGVESS